MIDLGLNDDQRRIVEGAVALLDQHSPVSRLRPGETEKDVLGELAAWGWFGVGLPAARGGMELGVGVEILLGFEAGRYLLPPAVLATVLAVRLCGDDRGPGLLAGETRAALGLQVGDDAYVFDRGDAGLIVLVGDGAVRLVSSDGFRGAGIAGFDDAVATEKGAIDAAATLAAEADTHARLIVCAMLAGIARASCDLAVEYAKLREQFGQPIGAFQAVKHICAEMGLRAYASEAQVRMAAAALADSPATAPLEAAAAALTSLRAARDNASDAIQVHGGIGFTAECEAHFFLKRAHLLGRLLGGPERCRSDVLCMPAARRA